ncbi:hypothetical protein TNCT_349921, partial [Trichonephila clavata]
IWQHCTERYPLCCALSKAVVFRCENENLVQKKKIKFCDKSYILRILPASYEQ